SSNNVSVWDIAHGNLVTNFTARFPNYLNCPYFTITGDGNLFAHVVQGSHGFVQVHDANGKLGPAFRVSDEYITAMAFSPDGLVLVTGAGYSEGKISLWHARTRQLIGSLEGHRSWVSCLKFLPDGK